MRNCLLALLVLSSRARADEKPLFTPVAAESAAAIVARVPSEVRRAIAGRAVESSAVTVFDGALRIATLYDAGGHRVALVDRDADGAGHWVVWCGDDRLEWSDRDGDRRPDERIVEHGQAGSGGDVLDERAVYERRGGRWTLVRRELLRDCGADYRIIEYKKDGRRRTRRASCIVS